MLDTGSHGHETRAFGSGVLAGLGDLAPGTLLGDWRVEAKIGEGGMGTVYAAVHEVIGKRAAIKVIRVDASASPGAGERFIQEARVVNEIGHPNIVDIFHVGRLEDGRPYLVMELLTGQTLGERIAIGRVPPLEAIEILAQMCAALGAAHARGVVHRDLKPDNVILTAVNGEAGVKLVDWGIAKMLDPATRDASAGQGTLVGTPRYIAPEQARGRAVDERTDIYSLGVIAYELFLETPPFSADNVADLLAAHIREPVPPPSGLWPDIPPELESLLLRMLAKEPQDRPPLGAITTGLDRAKIELLRRAGHVDGLGEAPPAIANLAVPVGDWSHAPPPVPERVAFLDTSELSAPIGVPRRRSIAVGLVTAIVALGVVVAFGAAFGREQRPLVPRRLALRIHASVPSSATAATTSSVLDLRVAPAGARIEIDGAAVEPDGRGRVVRNVPQGPHEIAIRAAGFVDYRRTIDVGPGALTLEVGLERAVEPAPELRPAPARTRPRPRRKAPPRVHPDATIDPFR